MDLGWGWTWVSCPSTLPFFLQVYWHVLIICLYWADMLFFLASCGKDLRMSTSCPYVLCTPCPSGPFLQEVYHFLHACMELPAVLPYVVAEGGGVAGLWAFMWTELVHLQATPCFLVWHVLEYLVAPLDSPDALLHCNCLVEDEDGGKLLVYYIDDWPQLPKLITSKWLASL